MKKNQSQTSFVTVNTNFSLSTVQSNREQNNSISIREIILYGLCLIILCTSMFISVPCFPIKCQ